MLTSGLAIDDQAQVGLAMCRPPLKLRRVGDGVCSRARQVSTASIFANHTRTQRANLDGSRGSYNTFPLLEPSIPPRISRASPVRGCTTLHVHWKVNARYPILMLKASRMDIMQRRAQASRISLPSAARASELHAGLQCRVYQ
jgi:hypothetical protein